MIRKTAVWLLALIFAVCLVPPSLGDTETDSPRVISAWFYGGVVYAAVKADSWEDPGSVEGQLMIDNASASETAAPTRAPSHKYVLMVDLSTSMPRYKQDLDTFAGALLSEAAENVTVTLSGFGERYEVIADELTSAEEVRDAVSKLKFNHRATDICGGTVDAIENINSAARPEGQIMHLIILTDGVPYLTGDKNMEEMAVRTAASSAEKLIGEASEVIVHTVCFGDWEPVTFTAVSVGPGIDLSVKNSEDAEKAGREIALFASGLYEFRFPANRTFDVDRIDAQIFLKSPDFDGLTFLSVPNLRDIGKPLEIDEPDRPALVTPEPDPEDDPSSGSSDPEPAEYPDAGEDGDGEPEPVPDVPPGGDTAPGAGSDRPGCGEDPDVSGQTTSRDSENGEDIDGEDGGSDSSITVGVIDSADDQEESDNDQIKTAVVLSVIAALVLLVIILTALLLRSRKKGNTASARTVGVKLEMLEGRSGGDGNTYRLRDELIIGSGKNCDIVLNDSSVLAKNARVYFDGRSMYIEDIGGSNNVSLSGMRIFAPNRLRSGDEIWIGSVCFRLLF